MQLQIGLLQRDISSHFSSLYFTISSDVLERLNVRGPRFFSEFNISTADNEENLYIQRFKKNNKYNAATRDRTGDL